MYLNIFCKLLFATMLVGGLLVSSNDEGFAAVSSQIALSSPAPEKTQNSLDFTVYKTWCEADHSQNDNWQVQLGYCLGYLQGLYWGQVIGSPSDQRPFCLPANLSKSDMIDALERYARSHPAQLASLNMTPQETAVSVAQAFKEHFSCP